MFLLDINVISDMMRSRPTQAVAAWVTRQATKDLWTASFCQAEILAGIAILPAGRRRAGLDAAARAIFQEDFEGRVLGFDSRAAEAYAGIFAASRRAGRGATMADMMIASIALSHRASVATRNIADFAPLGVEVVDPWDG